MGYLPDILDDVLKNLNQWAKKHLGRIDTDKTLDVITLIEADGRTRSKKYTLNDILKFVKS